MSHSVTLVLVPKDELETPGILDGILEEMMAPFDENLEAEEHDEECYCIGSLARKDSIQQVNDEFGNLDLTREALDAEVVPKFKALEQRRRRKGWGYEHETYSKLHSDLLNERQRLWENLTKDRFAKESEIFAAHPMKEKPDPDCEECEGTGKIKSTRNPEAKWDWWMVGGRWHEMLNPDYEPRSDPENLEICLICNGTGRRDDALGRRTRLDDPTYTCNGCSGTGKSLKWPSGWVDKGGNIRPVEEILAYEDIEKFIPFAFLTPDGDWIERGEMGWFGITSNEKDPDDWNAQAKAIFEKYRHCVAVVVDCHI